MKKAYAIGSISRQLGRVAGHIDSLAEGIQNAEQNGDELKGVLSEIMLDELEHAQMLTLKLTELVTADMKYPASENTDGDGGSVFSAGDLTVKKNAESEQEDEMPYK